MPFFKRRWNESPGGKRDSWGRSWWYFETGDIGSVQRQIEVYDAGPILRYDELTPEDEFGGLAQGWLWRDEQERSDFEPIRPSEFEAEWSRP